MDDPEYIDIPIFCGPVIKREISKGICSSYVDVTYVDNSAVDGIPLHAILFQNYYTSSISISHNGTGNAPSFILPDKRLMENPYFEKDGNKWCEVYAAEFNDQYVHRKSFRISLFQPANTWANFEIRNIKAVGLDPLKSKASLSSESLSKTSVNGVSTSLLKSDGNTILQMMKRTVALSTPAALN